MMIGYDKSTSTSKISTETIIDVEPSTEKKEPTDERSSLCDCLCNSLSLTLDTCVIM